MNEPRGARSGRAARSARPQRAETDARENAGKGPSREPPARPVAAIDEVGETGVLLDALIHDLRTPLSAMSGWLEVLEAHFGAVDGIVGRALLGLRRGVEGQTQTLNGISDVLTKQRVDLPGAECNLLAQLQRSLSEMDGQPDAPLDPAAIARLAPFRTFKGSSSLACAAGATFGDACGTLLRALAAAQGEGDEPLAIEADDDVLRIRVPGASGDLSSLESISSGLRPHPPRRPQIRPQALWLARSIFRRCNLQLRLVPAAQGGVELLIAHGASPGQALAR